MDRTVVVLGATGYLGGHICGALAAAGDRVIGVSRHGAIRRDLLRTGSGELAALLDESGADAVVNASGAVWRTSEEAMTATNDLLTARLVEAVARAERRPRLVHLGTVHEYGPGARPHATSERARALPVTPYGRTKLAGTRHVLEAVERRGLNGIVLRVGNVSGPGAPEGSLLGAVTARLATGRASGGDPVELRLAPLGGYRDYVDARDVADAVLAAAGPLPDPSHGGEPVVNVGRGEAVSVPGLVRELIALSGVSVHFTGAWDGREQSAAGDVEWQCLDVGLAARTLGWRARRSLEESLRDQLTAPR